MWLGTELSGVLYTLGIIAHAATVFEFHLACH